MRWRPSVWMLSRPRFGQTCRHVSLATDSIRVLEVHATRFYAHLTDMLACDHPLRPARSRYGYLSMAATWIPHRSSSARPFAPTRQKSVSDHGSSTRSARRSWRSAKTTDGEETDIQTGVARCEKRVKHEAWRQRRPMHWYSRLAVALRDRQFRFAGGGRCKAQRKSRCLKSPPVRLSLARRCSRLGGRSELASYVCNFTSSYSMVVIQS
ncbi:hypothetical protein ACVI1K_003529 [Bradyrhizobium sp. USDA 4508]